MTGHRVVTVERGTHYDDDMRPRQGYAARCTCGELTFGAFPSRYAAREALRGHARARQVSVDTETAMPVGSGR